MVVPIFRRAPALHSLFSYVVSGLQYHFGFAHSRQRLEHRSISDFVSRQTGDLVSRLLNTLHIFAITEACYFSHYVHVWLPTQTCVLGYLSLPWPQCTTILSICYFCYLDVLFRSLFHYLRNWLTWNINYLNQCLVFL